MFDNMAQVLLYSGLSYLILLLAGLGLFLLVSPAPLRRYSLALAPLVGYCYLTLVGWHLYYFGLRGTDSYSWYVMLPAVVLLAAVVYRRPALSEVRGWFDRGQVATLAAGALVIVVLSYPYLFPEGLTTGSIGNNDIAHNMTETRMLKELALTDNPGFLSQTNFLRHDIETNRFGSNYIVAILSSLFRLEPYQLGSLTINAFFAISMLGLYAVAVEGFSFKPFAAAAVAALFGMNPLMHYLIYNGFFPQFVGTGLMLGIVLVHLRAIEDSGTARNNLSYALLAGVLTWGMVVTYTHMVPFIYFLIAAYVVARAFLERSAAAVTGWGALLACSLALVFLISPARSIGMVSNLLVHAGMEAGWPMPYPSPDYLMGMSFLINDGKSYLLSRSIISFMLVVFLVIGLVRTYKAPPGVFYLAILTLAYVFGGSCYIYFMGTASNSFKSVKLASFFLPLVIPSVLVILRTMDFTFKRSFEGLLLFGILLSFNCYAVLQVADHAARHHSVVSSDMADLKRIETMPEVRSVNIVSESWWEALWQNGFLMKLEQHFKISTYAGREAGDLTGEWDVLPAYMYGYLPRGSRTEPLNSSYILSYRSGRSGPGR